MNRVIKLSLLAVMAMWLAACESRARAIGPLVCTLPQEQSTVEPAPVPPGRADLTGHARVGKASFYAASFAHRPMANGRRMDPRGDNAASRTLPLGTTAKVINLRTGQSAVVTIQDRGPYVRGRILDLSPATARKIGITRHVGVADVRIAPITVPLPGGGVKTGAGAQRPPSCRVASI